MNLQELLKKTAEIDQKKIDTLVNLINKHKEIIILGNGGSNSIASHISQDYTKRLNKKSFTFSDPSRLTCYINDYGLEKSYAQFLSEFTSKDSLVILISSSGESENIINSAEFCANQNIKFIILTGFFENNTLRQKYSSKSELDLWIDSKEYGVVECAHQIFLHIPC